MTSNKIFKLVLFFILISLNEGWAQNCKFLKDTVYIVNFTGSLDNGRPITSYIILKDLTVFDKLKSIQNEEDYICLFFNKSILFEEPNFTLIKNEKLYHFLNKNEANSFFVTQSKLINKLGASYRSAGIKRFNNHKSISFLITKVIADFWIIDTADENLNSISDGFFIKPECYANTYLYNIKSIEGICKFKVRNFLN